MNGTAAEVRAALRAARGADAKLALRTHTDTRCPAGCGAEDGVRHLIAECPAYAKARHTVFGTHNPPLTVLRTDQLAVWRYLKKVGRAFEGKRAQALATTTTSTSTTTSASTTTTSATTTTATTPSPATTTPTDAARLKAAR